MDRRLNKKLIELKKDGLYPFHMPGHKRNICLSSKDEVDYAHVLKGAYDIDITEIDGFDNLHDAKDLILQAEEKAAKLYKSEETHFLVNGSTSGILSAISAVCKKGDKVIVARNCHVSVYNAIYLNELDPVYVYPEVIELSNDSKEKELKIAGSIKAKDIERAILSNPMAKAVIIASPTYDGVLSDVLGIARLAHEYDIPLIVDEAHGALFYLEGRSAVDNKADIVINSLHKTLPSLTQTALIHINGTLVDRNRVKKYLGIFQTSSPSYVLMGSMDYAIEIMEEDGSHLYRDFCIRTMHLKEELRKLRRLEYLSKEKMLLNQAFDYDESKVLISTSGTGMNGREIYNILREKYNIQPEMAAGQYVLLMTTLFDSSESIDILIKALFEIDKDIDSSSVEKENCIEQTINNNESVGSYMKGFVGNKSPKTVFAYPPGIPIVVSGEIVTESAIEEIEKAENNDLDIKCID